MIKINLDSSRVRGKIGFLQTELSPKQVAGTLNAVLKSTRGYASRLARGVINLKAKQIIKTPGKNSPHDRILAYKTTAGKLKASLYFTAYRPNISEFGAKPSQKGATVTTWKGLGRQYIHHAWRKKNVLRFKRQNGGWHWYKRKGKERIPYSGLRGPSMAEVMYPATSSVMRFATKRMEVELLRKVRRKFARG